MNRRINHLSQVLQEMKDRYGSDDPVVIQLKEAIDQFNAIDSLSMDSRLPFGERRSVRAKPSYWNVKLRHTHQPLSRHDILAECKRIEHRVFSA
ncbi:MAG: hypothetical protein KGN32_10465 [Burkholderiales bacterium]|nr:hypothetical protein [Burkholderiales bacterium]